MQPTAQLTAAGELRAAAGASRGSRSLRSWLAGAFLPDGYPHSVTDDYLSYQWWDTVQGACSYVRGMLASQALLEGVGVGSAAATPAAAALQFFLRDLAGMVGGIAFAAAQGSSFDAHAKQWRLAADVANDLGMTLELAAPIFPAAFLAMACTGAACSALTGVAGAATRTALTQHFALRGNGADIAAKEGSQETAVTLVGMAAGLALTRAAAASAGVAWAVFAVLTALHVWANVRALRCLRMTSLNRPRLDILLRAHLESGSAPSPADVAARESLLAPPAARALCSLGLRVREPSLLLAPPLARLDNAARRRLAQALADGAGDMAVAVVPETCSVVAVLGEGDGGGASSEEEAVVRAYCVARMTSWREQGGGGGGALRQRCPLSPPLSAAAASAVADPSAWWGGVGAGGRGAAFLEALRAAGWSLTRPALMAGGSRLAWGAALRTKED